MKQRWQKQQAGFYTYGDTGYAVAASYDATASDGHFDRTGRMMAERTEWAAVRNADPADHNSGENIQWFDTMREARGFVEMLQKARDD